MEASSEVPREILYKCLRNDGIGIIYTEQGQPKFYKISENINPLKQVTKKIQNVTIADSKDQLYQKISFCAKCHIFVGHGEGDVDEVYFVPTQKPEATYQDPKNHIHSIERDGLYAIYQKTDGSYEVVHEEDHDHPTKFTTEVALLLIETPEDTVKLVCPSSKPNPSTTKST